MENAFIKQKIAFIPPSEIKCPKCGFLKLILCAVFRAKTVQPPLLEKLARTPTCSDFVFAAVGVMPMKRSKPNWGVKHYAEVDDESDDIGVSLHRSRRQLPPADEESINVQLIYATLG